VSERSRPCASRQIGFADCAAIPSSSGRTSRSAGRWAGGNPGEAAPGEQASKEEAAARTKAAEGELLPSPGAAEAVVATFWYRRKVAMGGRCREEWGTRASRRRAPLQTRRRSKVDDKIPKSDLGLVATTSLDEMITPVSQQQPATTRLIDFEEGVVCWPRRQDNFQSEVNCRQDCSQNWPSVVTCCIHSNLEQLQDN
jgi:hypothetical protein